MNNIKQLQQGVALLTALAFLVIITVIAVVAMQSSNTQLRMANSQEEQSAARQTAQSCLDSVINNPNAFIVTGNSGTVNNNITVTQLTEFAHTNLTLTEVGLGPVLRGLGTSGDKFRTASFSIQCDYDNSDNGRGKDSLVQGFMILTPKM